MDRRDFLKRSGFALASAFLGRTVGGKAEAFRLHYAVSSSLYGKLPLSVIVPQVKKAGSEVLDVWPLPHGNQREQIEKLGHEAFKRLLARNGVKLGIITRYDLGPFRLREEMKTAREFGAKLLVCGGRGPRGLKGAELKSAVRAFAEKMKPHVEEAARFGVTIGIENHANNLIESPDSMKYLVEFVDSPHLGIALAPYHLPQRPELISRIIRDLGGRLVLFYAWQHGKGCHKKLPKEEELLQLPGRGPLDFRPIVEALRDIRYRGWTEIFMHPVPRGIPILPTAEQVTQEINRSRRYLETIIRKESGHG